VIFPSLAACAIEEKKQKTNYYFEHFSTPVDKYNNLLEGKYLVLSAKIPYYFDS